RRTSLTVDDDSRQERTPKVDSTARERLISPTFVLAWVVNFLQYLLFYLLVTTIALYAVREFAASQTASGLAASSFVIGATLGRIFCGYVIDTLGKRPVLLVSAVVI